MFGKMRRPSGTWMRPRATIAEGRSRSIATSSNRIEPVHGRTTPEMAWLSVDFPAPFEPNTATISPCPTTRSTPRRISVPPYPARRLFTTRMDSGMGASCSRHPAGCTAAQIGLDHTRISRDCARRTFRNDAPLGQHEHVLGKAQDRLHDVLDHD